MKKICKTCKNVEILRNSYLICNLSKKNIDIPWLRLECDTDCPLKQQNQFFKKKKTA